MRKLLSVVSLTLIAVLFLTSCRITDIAGRVTGNQPPISTAELSRLIINAIDNEDSVAESFSSIPEKQRPDVSFSYFTEYTDIMRRMSQQNGTVSSFRITESADGFVTELLYESGDIPVYLYLAKDEDGTALISSDIISDIISVYNYSEHYFSMLDEQNIEGIYTLLSPMFSDEQLSDNAIYARASALADFYFMRVKSTRDSYLITELTPDSIRVLIPEVISSDGENFNEHEVVITKTSSDSYGIDDTIPLETDYLLTYIIDTGVREAHCGNNYTSSIIYNIIGHPSNVSIGVEGLDSRLSEDGTDEYMHKIIVNYPGMLLVFEGYGDAQEWDGKLVAFRLFTGVRDSISVGSNITIGMTKEQIQSVYPFIDLYDYILFYNAGDTEYKIEFEFDDSDILTMVRVSEV